MIEVMSSAMVWYYYTLSDTNYIFMYVCTGCMETLTGQLVFDKKL